MSSREWVPLEIGQTHLSIAVALIDTFTQRTPRRPPHVGLKDRAEQFRRTREGYFVLTDLPADVEEVTVVVDESPYYLSTHHTVEQFATDLEDASEYEAEEIEIAPGPGYRFPAGTTLVRGQLTDGDAPVSGGALTIDTDDVSEDDEPGFIAEGWSDPRGEFALYLWGITKDDLVEEYESGHDNHSEISGRLVHVGGEPPVVMATHPETGAVTSASTPLPAGITTSLDLDF